MRFGTKDVALILARITRGLQLAAALHATLPKDRQPQRRARPARSAPDMRKPRTRPTPPQRNDLNSVLATLPTPKEIAAQLRHRPVGDVLAEICIELGILTADDFWQELEIALVENGADRDRIVEDADERITLSEAAFFPPETRLSPPTAGDGTRRHSPALNPAARTVQPLCNGVAHRQPRYPDSISRSLQTLKPSCGCAPISEAVIPLRPVVEHFLRADPLHGLAPQFADCREDRLPAVQPLGISLERASPARAPAQQPEPSCHAA